MEEVKNEPSLGKISVKFTVKFILWSILFFVIGAIIVGVASGSSISNIDSNINGIDDIKNVFGAVKGFIYGLVIVDLIVAFLATKLSIGGIAKKITITSENKPQILKRISIILTIIAVIVIVLHTVIVKNVDKMIMKDIDDFDSLGELIKEADDKKDEIANDFGIDAEEELDEALSLLKGLNAAGYVYSVSGLLFLVMIPVSNFILKKKIK